MSNSFFINNSGSLFFISGSYGVSSSVSTSISSDPDGAAATQSTTITSFPDPSANAYATITLDSSDNSSFIVSGSNQSSSFYMSSSGKYGFGTIDPVVDFDIRSDEFQIQKTGKRQGIKVNEEGNLESFNSETDAAATGSEFILSYTRGGAGKVTSTNLKSILGIDQEEIDDAGGAAAFFQRLHPRDKDKTLFLLEREGGNIEEANVGDVLGSIRWIAASGSTSTLDSRTAGEAATIQAVVNAANKFGTSADLIFKVADRAALEGASSDLGEEAAPKVALILDGNYQHELTGSLTSTGNITSPNITADSSSFSTRVTTNDAKVGYTDAAVKTKLNTENIISSSAQIASDISGSFIASSGSFSTRVTTNDAKVGVSTGTQTIAGAKTFSSQIVGTIKSHKGSATKYYITPTDFYPHAVVLEDSEGGTPQLNPAATGRVTATGAGTFICNVTLPIGTTPSAVVIYGSDTRNTVRVYSNKFANTSNTALDGGRAFAVGTNTSVEASDDNWSAGTHYLTIAVTTDSADTIYGGIITMS